jgi:hypothetical protein
VLYDFIIGIVIICSILFILNLLGFVPVFRNLTVH